MSTPRSLRAAAALSVFAGYLVSPIAAAQTPPQPSGLIAPIVPTPLAGTQQGTSGTNPSAAPVASDTLPPTVPAGSAQGAAAPSGATPHAGGEVFSTCTERLGKGRARPKVTETFPKRGLSGHAAALKLDVEHLAGETLLPAGFGVGDEEALKSLEKAGFVVPDASGGAGPHIERTKEGTKTSITIPLLLLPAEPGRNELTLPPLPISLARSNGQLHTLCTSAHEIVVEDPTANDPEPKPKPNPEARPQREHWALLEQLVYGGLVALVFGALFAWLFARWRRRPRPAPPAPPPRPPWEVALEELHDIRHAGLIKAGHLSEHFDRVSDTVRKYLGDRFGFDGLESTTREALALLEQAAISTELFHELRGFLRQADLVKFANLTPSEEECQEALTRGEAIVRRTMVSVPPPGATTEPTPNPKAAGGADA